MEKTNNTQMSAKETFRKILRDKKTVSMYLKVNGSLRGFNDPEVKLVKPL